MNDFLISTGIVGAAYGGVICLAGAVGLMGPCPTGYNCSELQHKAAGTLLNGGLLLGTGATLFVIGAERDRKNGTKI